MPAELKSSQIETEIRSPKQASNNSYRNANVRTLRALDNISRACNHLGKLNAPITLSAVASFTKEQASGPSYGGLRNNKAFTAYVNARASEQGLTQSERTSPPLFPKTGDVQIDANISALRSHNRMLQRQIYNLKKLFRQNSKYDMIALLERGELVLVEETFDSKIDEDVRSALGVLLNPEALELVGLKLESTGQIVSPRSLRILLGKRQVDALRNLAKASGT
jgi:hypothetical protein